MRRKRAARSSEANLGARADGVAGLSNPSAGSCDESTRRSQERPAHQDLVVVVMVMPAPVAMMVGDVVAHDRAANAANDSAHGTGDNRAADSTGDSAAHDTFFSRLG